MKEFLTIYSCIYPQLMRQTLVKGLCLAIIGIAIFLYAGVVMPITLLKSWGLPLFLIGIGLITWGLLPYRRLTRLEKKPDQITLIGMEFLEFYSRGQKKMSVPLQDILKTDYVSSPSNYGIAIWLKHNPIPNPAPDFFFRYFSERGYRELHDWLSDNPT